MRCLTANILGDVTKPEDYEKVIGILNRRLLVEKTNAVISTLKRNIEILENKKIIEK